MQSLLLTLHIVVCVLLVILILLQSGKEGMGVIFGGGNSTLFGSTGAGGILVKLTTLMALIFVVTSLSYTYVTSSHTEKESVILDVQIENPASDVAKPEAVKQTEGAAGSEKPAKEKTEEPKAEPAQKSPAVTPEKAK